MSTSARMRRTRNYRDILKVLLEADAPLSVVEVSERSQVNAASVRKALARLEGRGWVCAPGQQARRTRGVARYYQLTEQARPLALAYI